MKRESGSYFYVKNIDGLSAAFFVVLDFGQLLLPNVAVAAVRVWLKRMGCFFFAGEREIKKTFVLHLAADADNSQPKTLVRKRDWC